MKTVDVKPSSYIDFDVENDEKDPKFEVDNHAKISKYKSIFAKGSVPIWSEDLSVIKKAKNTVS